MPQAQPELKKYLDKRLSINISGNRTVVGVLRGYDTYLNIVLDEAYEDKKEGGRERMGMCVVRGNSVVLVEPMERIGGDHHHGGGGRR